MLGGWPGRSVRDVIRVAVRDSKVGVGERCGDDAWLRCVAAGRATPCQPLALEVGEAAGAMHRLKVLVWLGNLRAA